MTPIRWWVALLTVILIGAASLVLINGYHERKAGQLLLESAALAGKAQQLADAGRAKDEAIAKRDADIQSAIEQVKAAKAAYAKLRASQRPQPSVESGGVPPSELPGDVVDGADVVISAQDRLIAEQKAQIEDLALSRDSWKSAFKTEQKRSRALEIALDTQKRATVSSKWIGRVQGFAIGIGIGYVGGKFK